MNTEVYVTLVGIGIQTAIYLLGGYAMIIRLDVSNGSLKSELGDMKAELRKLADVIIVQAVQSNRLQNIDVHLASLEKRVEDLRRGDGYVQRDINGEYPRR